ncbi:hypothetical protein CPLU01_15567 [Colletotrichum plurivorum]|uniref:Uncharacterized protein n=1 Tax=Colletotrichum plurivorum TaxID=2175906 RepID=A0A8H6J9L3_9PEZI|nr:hypothetical protein CPLU01_15567 [Colletotrichum plurivorum]
MARFLTLLNSFEKRGMAAYACAACDHVLQPAHHPPPMPEKAKPAMDQNSICRHSAAFQPLLIGRQVAVLSRTRPLGERVRAHRHFDVRRYSPQSPPLGSHGSSAAVFIPSMIRHAAPDSVNQSTTAGSCSSKWYRTYETCQPTMPSHP